MFCSLGRPFHEQRHQEPERLCGQRQQSPSLSALAVAVGNDTEIQIPIDVMALLIWAIEASQRGNVAKLPGAVSQKKKPRRKRGFVRKPFRPSFERVRNGRERGVQVSTKSLHNSDNRNRNSGRDQAVFDCRRARLIANEPLEGCLH